MNLIPASSGEVGPVPTAQEAISSPSSTTIPQGKNGVNTQYMQDGANNTPIDSTLKTEYNEDRGEHYGTAKTPSVDTGRNSIPNGEAGLQAGFETSGAPSVIGRDAGRHSGSTGISVVSNEARTALDLKGSEKLNIRDTTTVPADFSAALDKARASQKFGGLVDGHTADDLSSKGIRSFLSDDGMAGGAVEPDGNITAVFKSKGKTGKNVPDEIMLTALANGGTKLDCYAGDVEVFPTSNNYRTHKVINRMNLIPISHADTVPLSAASEKTSSSFNSTIPQGKNGVNTQYMQDGANSTPIDSTLKTEYNEGRGERYDKRGNELFDTKTGLRAGPTQSDYSERGRLLAGRHSGSTGISVVSNEDRGEYNGRINIGAAFRGTQPRGTGNGEADVRARRDPTGNQRVFRQPIINQAECS